MLLTTTAYRFELSNYSKAFWMTKSFLLFEDGSKFTDCQLKITNFRGPKVSKILIAVKERRKRSTILLWALQIYIDNKKITKKESSKERRKARNELKESRRNVGEGE